MFHLLFPKDLPNWQEACIRPLFANLLHPVGASRTKPHTYSGFGPAGFSFSSSNQLIT